MNQTEDYKKLSFKNFLVINWWVIKLYWKIIPIPLIAILGTTILLEIEVFVSSYIRAWVIDEVVRIKDIGNINYQVLVPIALVFFLLSLTTNLIRNFNSYFNRKIRWSVDSQLRILLYEKLRSLGVSDLELPELNNLIDRAQRNSNQVLNQFGSLTNIVSSLSAFIGSVIIIFSFFPLLVPLLILVSIPMILVDQKYLAKIWNYDRRITETRRTAYQSMGYLIDPKGLEELSITNGHKYLLKKFTDYFDNWYSWYTNTHKKWIVADNAVSMPRNVIRVIGFMYAIWRFLIGELTIGLVTFYISVIQNLSDSVFRIALNFDDLFESSQRIDELKRIFDLEPSFADGDKKLEKFGKGPNIELKNVSFSYPSNKKLVISDLNLNIKSGEKIAIVGHNGAGKTTLVKLICRFYQVSKGELLVNETNINKIKISSWYKNIGVLFQEYNTYPHLSAYENIMIGNLTTHSKMAKIKKAAKRADAHDFIKEFDKGYDQILSERYKGGIRPSTGQWQKIAIARFFYRDAPLVIFDEPTAAIDAVSEKRIFDKIYKFFEGKTVIIISHRFSTVRNADRIIVMEKGNVIEHGSHKELMDINGKYAHAFKLQAEGYKH